MFVQQFLRILCVIVGGSLCTSVVAGNLESPDQDSPPPRRLAAFSGGCGDGHFIHKTLETETQESSFFIGDSDLEPLNGVARVSLTVDPASGQANQSGQDFSSSVSIEYGYFSLVGTSPGIGIVEPTLLIGGQIIGLGSDPSDILTYHVDVTSKHPAVVEEYGDFFSIDFVELGAPFIYFDDPDGDDSFPWGRDATPRFDYCSGFSPFIDLLDDPAFEPAPVTYELSAVLADVDSTSCPLSDLSAITSTDIQITFDLNLRDLDKNTDARGVYFACDDSYGSLSGAKILLDGDLYSSSCVTITVGNDVIQDDSTIVDTFTIEISGRSAVRGLVLSLIDTSATAFPDDGLPDVAPDFSSSGEFDLDGATPMSLNIAGICQAELMPVSLNQVSDIDFDGIADSLDNCIGRSNVRQRDSDGDGFGNACDPDLNNDGIVNATDLGLFRTQFFQRGNLDSDYNSDGVVNAFDLGRMRAMFFGPPGPSGIAN